MTWKDAILIELASIKDRIEQGRKVSELTLLRLASMIRDEHNPTAK